MAKHKDEDEKSYNGSDVAHPLERIARLTRAAEHGDQLNPAQRETLRYLAKCNRFSNSPGALTQYLGATKGTVSQTVKALERKGHIEKSQRESERRSIVLLMTEKGRAALGSDPWAQLASVADRLSGKTRRRLARGLTELLAMELANAKAPPFGNCHHCRFFREKGRSDSSNGPHLCMLLDEPLRTSETSQICVYHEPA